MRTKSADDADLFTIGNEPTITLTKESDLPANDSYKKSVYYWNKCLEIIKDNVNNQVYKTWFEPIKALKWEGQLLTLQVPSQFFCEWIEEHYYNLLQKTIYQVMGDNARLQYQVVLDDSDDSLENRTIKVPAFRFPPQGAQSIIQFTNNNGAGNVEFSTNLNPRYSFDNFITGESNQLASSAAFAVAKNPGGTRFNPLVIYGDTGLGKTHLAQAIGNYITGVNKNVKALYTNSEVFTMEFVNAIQNNKVNDFINYYRSVDILIVDDIQFFGGKEKTQDNFFHTFNALHQAGKQLVLTSDKPPKDLRDVDDRLISRFQWGLTVDVQHPDLEMRMAILQKKSLDEGIDLPADSVEYLARNVKSSIRELEGTLISLIAKVTLDKRDLNLDLVREVVQGMAKSNNEPLTIDTIKETVASYYKLPVEILASPSRKHEIALARQMSMFLAKRLTQNSLKTIGSHFGNRDHSTVLHSCQTIDNYLATDRTVKAAYEYLLNNLKNDGD